MLARSKIMLAAFDDIELQMDGKQVERVKSCEYRGVLKRRKMELEAAYQ